MAHFKTPFSIQCTCGKIYSKNSQFDAGYSGNYIRIICQSCDEPIIFEAFDDFSRYDVMVGCAIRMSDLNWYHRALIKLQEEDTDDEVSSDQEVSSGQEGDVEESAVEDEHDKQCKALAAKSIADLQSAEESESSKEGDVEESAVEDEHDKQCKALAAKSIADLQSAEESESSKEGDVEESAVEDEHDKQRKAAVHKLEKASEDTILRQLLKALDTSVENLASGARRGGSNLVHKLEDSAVNVAESIQQGGIPAPGSLAPSILESGEAFTAKGMQVLELVCQAKILITETGIQVQGNMKEGQPQDHEDQLFEEVTFDRCFYIYGGPEQLEELEALANHYTLLFNRGKAKLSSEQKSFYEGKLKQLQQIFSFSSEIDGSPTESEKGKKIETGAEDGADSMKILHDSSVSKAAEMAAGFANALAGIAANDIIQKTAGRLDSLHSEGVHRLSEICCSAVSQLLMLAKSVISNANKAEDEDVDEDVLHMDWPEDSIERAKIIRTRAQSMTGNVEAVCNSFITGIADVAEAYAAAIKGATADSQEVLPQKSIQEKADSLSKNLHSDQTTAVGKIQDGLQYLTYVVLSTSMHVA